MCFGHLKIIRNSEIFVSKSRILKFGSKKSKLVMFVVKNVRFSGHLKILKNRDLAAGENFVFLITNLFLRNYEASEERFSLKKLN